MLENQEKIDWNRKFQNVIRKQVLVLCCCDLECLESKKRKVEAQQREPMKAAGGAGMPGRG